MSRRILSGIVLHVLAVLLLLAPAWLWFPLVIALSLRLNAELAPLLSGTNAERIRIISSIGGGLVIAATYAIVDLQPEGFAQLWHQVHPLIVSTQAAVLGLALIGTFCLRLFDTEPRATSADIAYTWLGILYAGWLPSFFPLIRLMPEGQWLLAWTVGGAVLSDNAALLFGRWLGRRPFFAHISPNKTVEGAVGSLVVTVAALVLAAPLAGIPLPHAVILASLVAVGAQAGDLAESLLKRDAGAKDSAALIPGHGGLLDRLDSLLFVGLISYFYLAVFVVP